MGLFDKLFGKQEQPKPTPLPAETPASDWEAQGTPQELQPAEVVERLAAPNPPILLDVREKRELEASGWIPGSVNIPTSEIQGRLGELDLSRPVIVYCASGMRSFDVGFLLIQSGCKDVSNLNGGIKAWKGEIARA